MGTEYSALDLRWVLLPEFVRPHDGLNHVSVFAILNEADVFTIGLVPVRKTHLPRLVTHGIFIERPCGKRVIRIASC